MQHLGQTRSSLHRDHALLTPDTFVRAPLPGMTKATAIVHTAPAMGAAFTQYTAEMEEGGSLGPALGQRFLFVLDGEIEFEAFGEKRRVAANGFAFAPSGLPACVSAVRPSRVAVIEKEYQALENAASPKTVVGEESHVAPQPLLGDEAIEVRALLSNDPSFDFAVNTMTYRPGAALSMVEIHVMEHGLLMLQGEGVYRLGEEWYPVTAGDFIWMSPYCPQWFGALGKIPAKYLIYKDWNRHPLK